MPENGISQVEELFGGECSSAEIERLGNLAREKECDVIVASGGGKASDTAKGRRRSGEMPRTVIVPTIASSDAPCSAMSVIYKERWYNPEDSSSPYQPRFSFGRY